MDAPFSGSSLSPRFKNRLEIIILITSLIEVIDKTLVLSALGRLTPYRLIDSWHALAEVFGNYT